VTAALDVRGLKRICTNCGARFYDMNKRPIICPACNTEFTGEVKVKTRRSRASAANEVLANQNEEAEVNAKAEDTGDDESVEIEAAEDDDIVSLEEIDDDDSGSDDDEDDIAPDLDIDDDLDDLDDIETDLDDDD